MSGDDDVSWDDVIQIPIPSLSHEDVLSALIDKVFTPHGYPVIVQVTERLYLEDPFATFMHELDIRLIHWDPYMLNFTNEWFCMHYYVESGADSHSSCVAEEDLRDCTGRAFWRLPDSNHYNNQISTILSYRSWISDKLGGQLPLINASEGTFVLPQYEAHLSNGPLIHKHYGAHELPEPLRSSLWWLGDRCLERLPQCIRCLVETACVQINDGDARRGLHFDSSYQGYAVGTVTFTGHALIRFEDMGGGAPAMTFEQSSGQVYLLYGNGLIEGRHGVKAQNRFSATFRYILKSDARVNLAPLPFPSPPPSPPGDQGEEDDEDQDEDMLGGPLEFDDVEDFPEDGMSFADGEGGSSPVEEVPHTPAGTSSHFMSSPAAPGAPLRFQSMDFDDSASALVLNSPPTPIPMLFQSAGSSNTPLIPQRSTSPVAPGAPKRLRSHNARTCSMIGLPWCDLESLKLDGEQAERMEAQGCECAYDLWFLHIRQEDRFVGMLNPRGSLFIPKSLIAWDSGSTRSSPSDDVPDTERSNLTMLSDLALARAGSYETARMSADLEGNGPHIPQALALWRLHRTHAYRESSHGTPSLDDDQPLSRQESISDAALARQSPLLSSNQLELDGSLIFGIVIADHLYDDEEHPRVSSSLATRQETQVTPGSAGSGTPLRNLADISSFVLGNGFEERVGDPSTSQSATGPRLDGDLPTASDLNAIAGTISDLLFPAPAQGNLHPDMANHFVPATNVDDAGSGGRSARTNSIGGSSELDSIVEEDWRRFADESEVLGHSPSGFLNSGYN